MQDTSTLIHQEFSSQRTFDAVVAAFEAALGPGDGKTFQSLVDQTTAGAILPTASVPPRVPAASFSSLRWSTVHGWREWGSEAGRLCIPSAML